MREQEKKSYGPWEGPQTVLIEYLVLAQIGFCLGDGLFPPLHELKLAVSNLHLGCLLCEALVSLPEFTPHPPL